MSVGVVAALGAAVIVPKMVVSVLSNGEVEQRRGLGCRVPVAGLELHAVLSNKLYQ
jgi:hypothetical protein